MNSASSISRVVECFELGAFEVGAKVVIYHLSAILEVRRVLGISNLCSSESLWIGHFVRMAIAFIINAVAAG